MPDHSLNFNENILIKPDRIVTHSLIEEIREKVIATATKTASTRQNEQNEDRTTDTSTNQLKK